MIAWLNTPNGAWQPHLFKVESVSAAWAGPMQCVGGSILDLALAAAVLRSLLAHGQASGAAALLDVLDGGGWSEGRVKSAVLKGGLGESGVP